MSPQYLSPHLFPTWSKQQLAYIGAICAEDSRSLALGAPGSGIKLLTTLFSGCISGRPLPAFPSNDSFLDGPYLLTKDELQN